MTTTDFLEREIRHTELSIRRAERKPNAPPEELHGLHEKLEHLQDALYAVEEHQRRRVVPLVYEASVPTVGDYIERQAVLDAVWPVDPDNDGSDGGTVILQTLNLTSADIEAIVSDIPAADVRPVVRGRWLHETEIEGHACGECSACHKIRVIDNFCPNCGADMREGNPDGQN